MDGAGVEVGVEVAVGVGLFRLNIPLCPIITAINQQIILMGEHEFLH